MTTPEELKPTGEADEQAVTPTGRAAFMGRYKQDNPDREDDPNDDELSDYAMSRFGEHDELRGKYDSLNGANEKLAEAISTDPRFAQFVAEVGNGTKPIVALGRIFGTLLDKLDEEGLADLQAGQEEYAGSYNQLKQNYEAYKANLKQFGETTGLNDAMLDRINNAVLDMSDAFANWDITPAIIEAIYKSIDYDEENAAKTEATALAAKNEAIESIKGNAKGAPAAMPDINAGKQVKSPRPKFADEPKDKPYSDRLEVVNK